MFQILLTVGALIHSLFPALILSGASLYIFLLSKKHSHLKYASHKKQSHGVIFGKKFGTTVYSPSHAEGHIAVFGGTGLGKTSALLIPTLRAWDGYSLTIDISGDISSNADVSNKLIYTPMDPQSIPYNVFGQIDLLEDESEQNEALEQLALLIMPDPESANSEAAEFFLREGRKILVAALIAFYGEGMDFIDICEKILESSYQNLFRTIDASKNENAIRYINSFEGASEKNTAGCKQACDAAIKLFATSKKIKQTVRRPEAGEPCFTPSEIESHNVFIIVPDDKLKLYAPLLHIIVAQSLAYFSGRDVQNTTPILFCLDEFASYGKLEILDALRKFRKRHIRIMALTQALADIDLIYGETARKAMLNNFSFKCVLGATDSDTQKYFAELIGHQIIKRRSVTKGREASQTETESWEWAIEPSDLGRLGNYLILLHPDGYSKLRKAFYWSKFPF